MNEREIDFLFAEVRELRTSITTLGTAMDTLKNRFFYVILSSLGLTLVTGGFQLYNDVISKVI